MLTEKSLVNVTCFYGPRVGLSNNHNQLTCISSVEESEIHIITGDFNGHVGKESVNFDTYHGGKGYGTRNPEGLKILGRCNATDLVVSDTFFDKNRNKLFTFSSTDNNTD